MQGRDVTANETQQNNQLQLTGRHAACVVNDMVQALARTAPRS